MLLEEAIYVLTCIKAVVASVFESSNAFKITFDSGCKRFLNIS